MSILTFNYNSLNNEQKSEQLLREVQQCPILQTLWVQANRVNTPSSMAYPWKVEVVTGQSVRACCLFESRTICIASDLDKAPALGELIFELLNTHNCNLMMQAVAFSKEGKMSCEEYAKSIEKAEFNTLLIHKEITADPTLKARYGESIQVFKHFTNDFETYWEAIKTQSHSQIYRDQWGEITGKTQSTAAEILTHMRDSA